VTGAFMTQRSLTILISLILIVLGVSAVLLCKCTTLFNGSGLPRGLVYSWYEEGPLRSGEVMPFDRLMLPHVSSMTFLEFKGHRYDKICGRPPFIEKVPNTPLRLFVSLELPEKKLCMLLTSRNLRSPPYRPKMANFRGLEIMLVLRFFQRRMKWRSRIPPSHCSNGAINRNMKPQPLCWTLGRDG
jgi:hypothetical protein